MKFVVDAQLPERVARWLQASGHDSAHDRTRRHVPRRIVISSDDENPRVMASRNQYQVVEQFEILVVPREQDPPCANGVHKMRGVRLTSGSRNAGLQNVMSGIGQSEDQRAIDGIIVNVQEHQESNRAHSSGVRIFGYGWYL